MKILGFEIEESAAVPAGEIWIVESTDHGPRIAVKIFLDKIPEQ
jgi:hypothetical protein